MSLSDTCVAINKISYYLHAYIKKNLGGMRYLTSMLSNYYIGMTCLDKTLYPNKNNTTYMAKIDLSKNIQGQNSVANSRKRQQRGY